MAVDPSASLVSLESLQVAELISNVAYGSTGIRADLGDIVSAFDGAGRDRRKN